MPFSCLHNNNTNTRANCTCTLPSAVHAESVSFFLLVIDKYKKIVELVLLDTIHIQVVLALVIFALTCNFVYIIESNDDDSVTSCVCVCMHECGDLEYVCMNFSFSILIVISMRSRL